MSHALAGRFAAAVCALAGLLTLGLTLPTLRVIDNPRSGLQTWEVGDGVRPMVLLHGYGSRPERWLPFGVTIQPGADRRFVFPRGSETTRPPDGPFAGRAWWRIDLASFIPPGHTLPDLSQARPAGLARASQRVGALLDEVEARLGSAPGDLILGGFSQGAMIAADIAFRADRPLKALILLSPTPVDEASWTRGMTARRGLPVFIAHGRHDTTLSFTASARLADTMQRAGLRVTWLAFDDGHEIPAEVVDALNAFLADAGAR